LYKIKLIAGRGFLRDFKTDSAQALILNETAVKTLGYSSPDEAIGKPFSLMGRSGKIIGVVRDYHFKGLKEKIKPMSMVVNAGGWLLSVNVSSSHLAAIVPAIEKQWAQMFPGKPFDYYFADEFFDRQYQAESRFGALFFNFAILAILISCLGLFGVASYSTIQRTKEVGIRKVLGASVSNILNLLSREFLILVFIAFVIASPIAWLFMNRWLEDFAYRITIRLWVFAVGIVLSLLVALFAISFQTIKAAIANPVKSLRTE
jgi:putative ABC transport system permease protein